MSLFSKILSRFRPGRAADGENPDSLNPPSKFSFLPRLPLSKMQKLREVTAEPIQETPEVQEDKKGPRKLVLPSGTGSLPKLKAQKRTEFGPILRLYCLLADLCLCSLLSTLLWQSSPILEDLLPVGKIAYDLIQSLCSLLFDSDEGRNLLTEATFLRHWPFISVYLGLCSLSVLILGVTPAQFGLSIRGGSDFVSNRVLGLFRFWLGILLAPFLIFDLPCLFGRQTVKEIICRCPLIVRNQFLQLCGTFFILPFFLLAPLFSPLVTYRDFLQQTDTLVFTMPTLDTSGKKENFLNEKIFVSPLGIHMNSQALADFIVIPDLKGDRQRPLQGLYFYQTTTQNRLLLNFSPNHGKLLQLIKDAESSNPFFSHFYPALAFHFTQDSLPPSRERMLQIEVECQNYLLQALNLRAENLLDFLPQNGPLIHGAMKVKVNLLTSLIDHRDLEEIKLEIFMLADVPFLTVITDSSNAKMNQSQMTFWPISARDIPPFSVHILNKNKDKPLDLSSLLSFVERNNWSPDLPKRAPKNKIPTSFDESAEVVNYFSRKVNSPEKIKLAQEQILRLFERGVKRAKLNQDEDFLQALQNSGTVALNLMESKKNLLATSTFARRLKEILP